MTEQQPDGQGAEASAASEDAAAADSHSTEEMSVAPSEPSSAAELPAPVPGIPITDDTASPAGSGSVAPANRPEVAVGAAFVGGFLLAQILRRLAR